MTRTTILLGPPGTGKTTTLLDEVERALKDGVPPERIAFFAFTKKASIEASSRAIVRLGISDKELVWFRTLHSAAFKILGLRRDEVMSNEHYKEMGAALGSFTFEHSYDETIERPPMGGGLGDRALSIYALTRARLSNVEQQWRAAAEPDISLLDATRFAKTLEAYKEATGLYDFNDFLDNANEMLDLDLMIIDEAQDLTAQQWAFARRIGALAKRVIIAGDDDQCIFQWAGADLRTFLSLAGNLRVLPQSYRLPQLIWNRSNSIAKRIAVRRSKAWQPRGEPGAVNYLDHPEQVQLAGKETWLLLTRHLYQLPQLRHICRDQGVVYQESGVWSNQAPSVRAVVYYERLRRGEPLTGAQANVVIKFIAGMTPINGTIPRVLWNNLAFPFKEKVDWMQALTALGTDEREYIRRLRREKESLSEPGRVVLSTIHGSKGGEAANVLLLPDISYRVMKGMEQDADQEARVWYVGTSRAKEALHIVKPSSQRFYSI